MYELTGAKKQYANIIKIDDLIRRGTYPSVERLAEVTGVSQRQVLRILKDMREVYQAPLQYDRQRKGYCYLLDGYSVADISLDEDESLALQVCSDFIAKVFGGTRLFARLHRGITSLLQRAELYDQEEGRVLGYAYAGRAFERAAYAWNAEISCYLDASVRGRGVGRQLYARIEDVLRA